MTLKGFRLYSFQLPDSMSPAPSPESNPNSPSPVTTMGRNLNDASPAQRPCDPTSYHESSKQQAEPASTFYLINASLPEVGSELRLPTQRGRITRMPKTSMGKAAPSHINGTSGFVLRI
ncbi:hypothetical protein Lal_00045114 [Lupinus albus]|nr:hypothetical protein Lal_00045114 [Lupinus albus]